MYLFIGYLCTQRRRENGVTYVFNLKRNKRNKNKISPRLMDFQKEIKVKEREIKRKTFSST